MDIKLILAIIMAITSLILAYFNYRLKKRIDNKFRQDEVKTQSYIDFISSIAALSILGKEEKNNDSSTLVKLTEAKTKIAIFGETEVVKRLADFDREHTVLNNEKAIESFMNIIMAMRVDTIGNQKVGSKSDLKQILFGKSC